MKMPAYVALRIAVTFLCLALCFSLATPMLVSSASEQTNTTQLSLTNQAKPADTLSLTTPLTTTPPTRGLPPRGDSGTHLVFLPLTLESYSSCDHMLEQTVTLADAHTNYSDVKPGDTVCIAAGTRGGLKLQGFQGTAENPITFINFGGQVVINSSTFRGIVVQDSRFFRLTGSGVNDIEYGIKIVNSYIGIRVGYRSNDFEIDHVEAHGSRIGIYVHDSDRVAPDHVMRNIHIHHNYVHDIANEGLYIGHSGDCDTLGVGDTYTLEDVELDHNVIEDVGEGMECNCVTSGLVVHHNRIRDVNQTQATLPCFAGISVWDHCENALIYGNQIRDAEGHCIGIGGSAWGVEMYNNLLVNCGHTHPEENASLKIFGEDTRVYNNTFVTAGSSGIHYSGVVDRTECFNNIVLDSSDESIRRGDCSAEAFHHNALKEDGHTAASFGFVRGGDYHLLLESPAVDTGTAQGAPSHDLDGNPRPQGIRYDIGAYEFVP
jgi:hypothetical protein